MPVEEVSIGDYVLVGGEVAVLVMVEAVARLLPGVLGNPALGEQDSFSDGLLEGPVLHPAGGVAGAGGAGRAALRATTPRSPVGGATRRCERTSARRPDLLAALPAGTLDGVDRAVTRGPGDSAGRTPTRVSCRGFSADCDVWHTGRLLQRGMSGTAPQVGSAITRRRCRAHPGARNRALPRHGRGRTSDEHPGRAGRRSRCVPTSRTSGLATR